MSEDSLAALKSICHDVAYYHDPNSVKKLFQFVMDLPLDEWPDIPLPTAQLTVSTALNTEAFR